MDKKLLLLDKTLLLPVGGSQYVSGDGPYGEIHLSYPLIVHAETGSLKLNIDEMGQTNSDEVNEFIFTQKTRIFLGKSLVC